MPQKSKQAEISVHQSKQSVRAKHGTPPGDLGFVVTGPVYQNQETVTHFYGNNGVSVSNSRGRAAPSARQQQEDRFVNALGEALQERGLSIHLAPDLSKVGLKIAPLLRAKLSRGHLPSTLSGLLADAAKIGASSQGFVPNEKQHSNMLSLGNLENKQAVTSRLLSALQEQGIPASVAKQLTDIVSRHPASESGASAQFAAVLAETWNLARSEGGSEASILKQRERLPEHAPEIYSERADKSENAVDFLNRVWGPYIEAGILFQDDIKRLGDARLVQAIRNYCHARDLVSAEYLPPPQKERVDRMAETAPEGSAEALYAQEKLRVRKSVNRLRKNNLT